MIEQLTNSQRKQLAVGILVTLLLILFGVTVVPLWSVNASRLEHIHFLRARLAGLQQMADEEVNLRPRLEHLQRAQTNNAYYLKSSTETQAAAELQRLVKTITSGNKTIVTRTQVLPATEEQGFARITLKVRLRGPMRGIVESIYDIESNEPFLFLEDLHLQDTSRRRSAAAVAAKQIDAEFELIAYMVHNT
jgi:general secretion pathway protein M